MINFYINSGSNEFLAGISGSSYVTGSWYVKLVQDLDLNSGSFDVTLLEKTNYNDDQAIFTVSGSAITPTYFGQYTLTLYEYLIFIVTWSQANSIYSQTSDLWSDYSVRSNEKEIFVDRAFIQSGSNEIPISVYLGGVGTFISGSDDLNIIIYTGSYQTPNFKTYNGQ